jgi:carbamoyl-phosphate synthase large subunit
LERKTILVTGIGGNVGQGILRNVIASGLPVRIVGTNITELSAGNHWVDKFYKVPFGYDEMFIPVVMEIVEKEKIDLIIPSTDFEVYYLSLNQHQLNCKVACSDIETTRVYLDKFETWQMHLKHGIPFAESCLPSEYNGQFGRTIAKPRKGRGSKGLLYDIKGTHHLDDDEYMLQRLYEGVEVTTAVYRSYLDGTLHGLITMERSLENGATTYCKVEEKYDGILTKIALSILEHTGVRGSFNIQSIVTASGEIFPFEINCRISGTNSIRSAFGFKDVQYTIEELLWNRKPEKVVCIPGRAFRYLSDVIYPEAINDKNLAGNKNDSFIEF